MPVTAPWTPGPHGWKVVKTDHSVALHCRCQPSVPVDIRARWTVPEILAALAAWHQRRSTR